MKFKKAKILLAVLMLGGGMALSATSDMQNTFDKNDIVISETDYEVIANQLFRLEEIVEKPLACCKIYNSKFQLVYMSYDKNDEHLKQLKQCCDLIMKAGETSYYMISEH